MIVAMLHSLSCVNRELYKNAPALYVYFKDVLIMVKLFTK